MINLNRQDPLNESPYEKVSSRLDIKNGLAHCPAHDDINRSLSITKGKDERVLLHCHAGCQTRDIVNALGLAMADLFPSNVKQERHEIGRRTHGAPGYKDYRKTIIRYSDGSKTAFFERLENGSWLKGLNGQKQTLYNLDVLKEPGIKFISESEKDADHLTKMGFHALSFGGAENWKSEYTALLSGQEVIVLPHNDEPGRKAAEKVARDIAISGAVVKVVPSETWGQHKGADVADWLEAGHTGEELLGLVSEALPESPQKAHEEACGSKKPNRFKLYQVGQIELKTPEYLVDGLIERDSLALLFGDPSSGKSLIAVDVACSIATGKDFHGKRVKQGTVIYIAGEGQEGLVRRFNAWGIARGVDIKNAPLFKSMIPASMTDNENVQEIISAIDEIIINHGAPSLIIIDTVARNFGPGDENSTRDMNQFIHAADIIRAQYKAAVIPVHHTGHGDKSRARGSMALRAALDAEYRVEKDDTGIIRLEATKMKDAELPEPMAFRIATVELPMKDDEDRPITSAVLQETSYEPKCAKGKTGRGKNQTRALELLSNLHKECCEKREDCGLPRDGAAVSVEDWKDAMRKDGMDRKRIGELITSLSDSGIVSIKSGLVHYK